MRGEGEGGECGTDFSFRTLVIGLKFRGRGHVIGNAPN
jgi:hypothetical protein